MDAFISNIKYFLSLLVFSDYIYFGLIISLMILLVVLLYLIRSGEENLEWENTNVKPINEEQSNIMKIAKEIANSGEQLNIDLTSYEMKEEEDSVISYEELLKKNKNNSLNYDEDLSNEEVSIKRVDIINSFAPSDKESKFKPLTLSYEKEEALLAALKQLQKNLS